MESDSGCIQVVCLSVYLTFYIWFDDYNNNLYCNQYDNDGYDKTQ